MTTDPEPGHTWVRDAKGYIDTFAFDYEYHNGPYCTTCMEAFCIHCNPGWAETTCGGDDGYAAP